MSCSVRVAVCLLVVATLTGCGQWPGGSSREQPPGRRLDTPDGTLFVTAWLPDGWIYYLWTAELGLARSEIWRVAPGKPAEPVRLPGKTGCRRTEYLLPHRLPDGRLGLARDCSMQDQDQDHIDLVAFDPATRRMAMLAPLALYNPTEVSWRQDMRSGYVSHGSGICDGIAPLTRQGFGRFPGPVTLDGRTWRLEEVFFQSGDADCGDQGRADGALLTPDERRLVFLASPESQGKSGWARLDDPWHIYVQDPPGGQARRIGRGFSDTGGMTMAPDGRQVAITGRRGRERGVWLVDLDSGAMRKLAGLRFSSPAFSPDGRQLAVVFWHDVDHMEMRLLDLSG